jgi:hypothetical protein
VRFRGEGECTQEGGKKRDGMIKKYTNYLMQQYTIIERERESM